MLKGTPHSEDSMQSSMSKLLPVSVDKSMEMLSFCRFSFSVGGTALVGFLRGLYDTPESYAHGTMTGVSIDAFHLSFCP